MISTRHVWLALAPAALLAGGCAEPSCTGEWCGTAVVGVSGEAGSLFPPSIDTQIEAGLVDVIFAKLADIGPALNTIGDSGFVPVLASSWAFTDPTTLRFTLDPDARWHDGRRVTGDDVVFTFDVYRDTLVAAVAAPRLQRIASVTAPDSATVVFQFTEPYGEQFFDAVYHMRILPKHLLDTVPRDRLAAHPFGRQPVGAGPYRFVRWRAAEFIELEADSIHFRGRPGIPRLIWRFSPDFNALITQLVAGEVDILEYLGSPANIDRVERAPNARVVPYALPMYGYIAFNFRHPEDPTRPHPLFGDRELRRALAMAVDREAAIRAVLGESGQPAVGPLSTAFAIYSDTLHPPPFDSAEARRRLTALGWRDRDGNGVLERDGRPFSFTLLVPATSAVRVRMAEVIQAQLRRLGVHMTITTLDMEATSARAASGQFDAFFNAYGGDPSPVSIAEVWTRAAIGGYNYGRYVNPDVERLAARAMVASDLETAEPLWHAVVSRINADAPAIFMYELTAPAGVHTRFENVTFRPDQWTTMLWTWRIAPERMIDRDRYGVN